jgi:hypothetical protein
MSDIFIQFQEACERVANPFEVKPIITGSDIWNDIPIEISSFHQDEAKLIYKQIRQISQLEKVGILLVGDGGSGKSHLLRRVREFLEQEHSGLFAYIPPVAEPSRPDYHVRFHIIESFEQQNADGFSQWERLAANLIKTLKDQTYKEYQSRANQPAILREYISDNHKYMTHFELIGFVSKLAGAIAKQNSISKDCVNAVLLILFDIDFPSNNLFDDAREGAKCWLRGADSEEKVNAAKLPKYSLSEQQTVSIPMIADICKLAKSAAMPVVICFDQLENFTPSFDCPYTPSQVVAFCVERLHLKCENVILITSSVTDKYIEIMSLPPATKARVAQLSIDLKLPTINDMTSIIEGRLNWFYQHSDFDFPPFYPFSQDEISKQSHILINEKANLRDLMKRFAKLFDERSKRLPKTQLEEFMEKFHNKENNLKISSKSDDDIGAIIGFSLTNLHQESGGVKVTKLEPVIRNNDIQMVICGYDSVKQSEVRIGVRICDTETAATFNAVMKNIINYSKYNLTRGCLVRSKPLGRAWNRGKQLEADLKNKGGEVVVLKEEELKTLIAVYEIYQEEPDKKETEKLIQESKLISENRLIEEILSCP